MKLVLRQTLHFRWFHFLFFWWLETIYLILSIFNSPWWLRWRRWLHADWIDIKLLRKFIDCKQIIVYLFVKAFRTARLLFSILFFIKWIAAGLVQQPWISVWPYSINVGVMLICRSNMLHTHRAAFCAKSVLLDMKLIEIAIIWLEFIP